MLGENLGQLDAMIASARRMDCKALKRKAEYTSRLVLYNNAPSMHYPAYSFPNGCFVYYSTTRMGWIVSAPNGASLHNQIRPFPYLTRALRACYVIDQFIPEYLNDEGAPKSNKALELYGMVRATMHDSWMFTEISLA